MGGEGKNGGSSDKSAGGHSGQHSVEERKVIITGSPEAQWKVSSQGYFDRVKKWGRKW